MDGERAVGRHRLAQARQNARLKGGVEGQHAGRESRIDTGAELDGEGRVPAGEQPRRVVRHGGKRYPRRDAPRGLPQSRCAARSASSCASRSGVEPAARWTAASMFSGSSAVSTKLRPRWVRSRA